MAVKNIAFKSSNLFSATHTAGQKVYVRFSAAADDDGVPCNIYGANGAGVLVEESMTVPNGEGQVERLSSIALNSILFVDLGSTATTGTVSFFVNNGTAATGDIRVDTNPANDDTLLVGLTGFTETGTFKTTVVGDDQIKIGSTTAETADNIASWINDAVTGTSTPVDGTDWQRAGTAPAGAHGELTATVSASTVTITDKISGARSLAWSVTQGTGSTLTLRAPSGAVDGTALNSTALAAGERYISTSAGLDLDSPAVATMTLPAAIVGPTAAVVTGGAYEVVLRTGTPFAGTAPAFTLQHSHDGTNWFESGDTMPTLTASDIERVASHSQYARLNFSANALSTEVEMDAKFITQDR